MRLERDLASMRDMLRSIEIVLDLVSPLQKKSVERTQELHDAVLYRLIVIGEAASRVSKEGREEFREVPWILAIKTRNFLIHVYDQIKWDIVWDTVQNDLPPLEETLRKALDLPPSPGRSKSRGD
jgi:uncharacterized protein with HEPN domain